MSSVENLRSFISERLTAAAEEIFEVFHKVIVEYEEVIDHQRRLLDIAWKPNIKLHRIGLWQDRGFPGLRILLDWGSTDCTLTVVLPPPVFEQQLLLFSPGAYASSDACIPLSEPSSERLSGTPKEVNVTDDESESWVPLSGLQSLSGVEDSNSNGASGHGSEDAHVSHIMNLNENSSHYESDIGREDAHDVTPVVVIDETSESEPWTSLCGPQSVSGVDKVHNLHDDCGDSISRCPTSPLLFVDECSTESEPHFNDEHNCSKVSPNTSNIIPDDFDKSLGSIIGSEEGYSHLFEDSPHESVNEESHFEEVSHVREPLYIGSRLTQAQSFLLILSFALRHELTGMALSDLLDLQNLGHRCCTYTLSVS